MGGKHGQGFGRHLQRFLKAAAGAVKAPVGESAIAGIGRAGQGDDRLRRAAGQDLEQLQLHRRQIVKAIHYEERPVLGDRRGALRERFDGQPTQPGPVGPVPGLEAGLVNGVNLGQFCQAGFRTPTGDRGRDRGREVFREDHPGLEFPDQPLQKLDKSRPAGQRRIVRQRQLVDHSPKEAILNRVAQFGVDLAGRVQALGVQTAEGHHPHADSALPLCQALPPGAHLKLGGHDDARGQGQAPGRFADQVQDVGGFAGRGRSDEKLDGHDKITC